MKKLLSVLLTVLLVFSLIPIGAITVSADSTVWNILKGSPTINDLDDGYTSLRVGNAQGNAVYTKEMYDLEENAIHIRNFKLSEGTDAPWGAITFSASSDKLSTRIYPKTDGGYTPEQGFLSVLIRVNQTDPTKLMVFFLNEYGAEQLRTSVNRSDNLTIRFIEKETGYAMQVNEKLLTHDYITKFCNGGFHRYAYVIAHATHLMKGDFKIARPLWDVTTGTKTSNVYQSADNAYTLISNSDDSVMYTTSKVDLDNKVIQFKNLTLDNAKYFNINLNIDDALKSEADLSLKVEVSNSVLKLYWNNNLLGDVPNSNVLKLSLIKTGDNYSLVANGVVLDFGTALNNIFANSREVFVSIAASKGFSAIASFIEPSWVKATGSEDAVVTLNEDATNHIELSANQVVIAPEKYDIFTTGVTLSNLDIPDSDSNGKGAYVYFGTTFDSVPSIASADAVTLFVEKTANGVEFSLYKNSNSKKAYIGTVAEADKYNICFYWKHRSRTLKVNDAEFKLDKLTSDESKVAATDIETFLGTADKKEVYIALAATDYAKLDVELFGFQKPIKPEGVSLYTPSRVFNVNGTDETGYAIRRNEESYMITNLPWDYTVYALETRLNSVSGPIYFALSTTDVSDTNFWVNGEGSKINRAGFVITPLENNTKAQVSYYSANGEAAETVIAVINYNWSVRHMLTINKAEDSNWYLYIDDEPMNQVISPVLNDFMNTNGGDELFFILGSKSGLDVSSFKLKKQPQSPVCVDAEGWSATYNVKDFSQVEKDAETGAYNLSTTKTLYASRNGTEDIGKTSVKFKLNSIASGKFIYFALSTNVLPSEAVNSDNLLPSGTVDKVKKVVFRMYPDTTANTLTIKSYNDDGTGADKELVVLEDFDLSVAHTFDFRFCNDNNWYLCIDNVVLKDVKLNLLQDFLSKYSSKALYYCIGTSGKSNIEGLDIVPQQATDTNIEGVVENDYVVDTNLEKWYFYSTNRAALEGNDIDGYRVQRDADTFAYTDLKYNPNTTAISFKITDYGEWCYFALCTSDYNDTNLTPIGAGDVVNRAILILYPESDGNITLRYWCEDGSSKTPTTIATIKFDWFAENHTFDVRKGSDGDWYFCIDGKLIVNNSSRTLNLFMKTHAGEDLRYCFGGKGCLGIENAKVISVDKCISGEHNFSEEQIIIEPTCTESGEIYYSCLTCGVKESVIVKANGHDYNEGFCINCNCCQYAYTIIDNGAVITDCDLSEISEIVIPATLDGYPVTDVQISNFSNYKKISAIKVSPENNYFSDIDGVLFNKDKTELIYYPVGNESDFYTIPNSVKIIRKYAFRNCTNLKTIIIPDSVTSIGEDAFYNTAYYNDSSNWENNVLYIGNHLIKAAYSISGTYNIKDGTKTIADNAFYDCYSLTNITIPDSVTNIGDSAFYYCDSLTSIIIPDGVTNIGDSAFYYCDSLTSITIPDGVISIGNKAFYGCRSLTSIRIPDNVTSIGNKAFYGCNSLTSITIHDSVISIGDGAFGYCGSLTDITVDQNNSYYCSLNGVLFNKDKTEILCYPAGKTESTYTILDTVINIGYCAFSSCNSLTSITIPDSVTSIGDGAFFYCSSLTNITIPDSVTSIGYSTLYGCDSLTSIIIPDSVTSIGEYAFYGCDSLESVYYCGTKQQWNNISIGSNNSYLTSATRYYHISHEYDNACDTDCNVCGMIRTTEHTYDNVCDTDCNSCGEVRIREHSYINGICEFCNSYLETKHDYDTQYDETWVITKENTVSITISFSAETYVEKDWDFIYIYDGNDNEIGKYTAGELALRSITVMGDTVKIRLTSDRIGTAYGFKLTDIEFTCDHNYVTELKVVTCTEDGYKKHTCEHCGYVYYTDEVKAIGHNYTSVIKAPSCIEDGYTTYTCQNCGDSYLDSYTDATGVHTYENGNCIQCNAYLESEHDYAIECDETWTIYRKGATSVTITFSSDTFVEEKYDFIYIYDANDNVIGEYTGDELASKSITVSGDTVKIRLYSDRMITAYGFKITDISTEYIIGDCNADGALDVLDFIFYMKGLAEAEENNSSLPDLDKNGVSNVFDLVVLKKYLLGILKF